MERIANEFLDSSDIDIDLPTEMGTTALVKAAAGGHEGCVRMLMGRGADLMKENWYGPALHCAAEAGEVSTIEEVLSSGLDVDLRDHHGRTAFQCAIASSHYNAMQSLLSRGADVDAMPSTSPLPGSAEDDVICDDRNRPLRRAVYWDEPFEVLQLLLDNGANTELYSGNNMTVLYEACAMGNEEAVLLLLRRGANIHIKHPQNLAALHVAAGRGHVRIIQVLMEHGAEVDVRTKHGVTPLLFATERGCVDSVRKLLNWGADIKAQDDGGLTPLLVAIEENCAEVVSLLLDAGADVDAKGRPEYRQSPVSATPHPYTGGGHGPQSSYQIMQGSKMGNRATQVNSVIYATEITANLLI